MEGVNGVLNPVLAKCLPCQGFTKPYNSTRIQCAGVSKWVTLKSKGSNSLLKVRAEIEEVSPADQREGQRQSEEQSQSQAQAQARLNFLSRSQTHVLLKKQLAVAVLSECYSSWRRWMTTKMVSDTKIKSWKFPQRKSGCRRSAHNINSMGFNYVHLTYSICMLTRLQYTTSIVDRAFELLNLAGQAAAI